MGIQKEIIETELRASTSQAQGELSKLEGNTSDLIDKNKQLKLAMSKLEAEGKKNSDSWKNLNKLYRENGQQVTQNKAEMELLRKELGVTSMTATQLRKRANELRKELNSMTKSANPQKWNQLNKELIQVEKQQTKVRAGSLNLKNGMGMLSKAIPILSVTALVSGIKALGSELLNLAKTVQGEAIRSQTVFGDQLGYVEQQADKLSKKMGVTNREFVSMAAATADLLIPLDFTREQSAQMSVELQKLTGALDEWTAGSIGAKEVSNILTKAMLGENEQLKQLGIAIRKDTDEFRDLVKQKIETTGATKMQAEAMATLELIQKKSADAQAAYNKEGNKLLRVQKEVGRQWRQMKENVVGWFEVKTVEKLKNEQRQVNNLVFELTKANNTEDKRREILEKLQAISPKIVEGLSAENINVEKLKNNLRLYNEELSNRIILANLEEDEQKNASKLAKVRIDLANKQADAYNYMRESVDFLKDSHSGISEQIDSVTLAEGNLVDKLKQFQQILKDNNFYDPGTTREFLQDIDRLKQKLNEQEQNSVDYTGRINQLKDILGLNQQIKEGEQNEIEKSTSNPIFTPMTEEEKETLIQQAKEFLNQINEEFDADSNTLENWAKVDIDAFEANLQEIVDAEALAVQKQIDLEAQKYAEIGKLRWQDYNDQVEYLKGVQQQVQDYAQFAGNLLADALEDGKLTQQEMLKILTVMLLKAVKNTVIASITSATAQSLAQADSVATFGISGALRAGILVGLIEAAYSGIESRMMKSAQAYRGRYPVIGAEDGRTYLATYSGESKTGFMGGGKPTLINEHGPEFIIDSPTTKNIQSLNPGLINTIMSYRVPQRAEGNYPVVQQQQQQNSVDLASIIQQNTRAMHEITLAAKNMKAKVVYSEIEDAKEEMDSIRSYASGS